METEKKIPKKIIFHCNDAIFEAQYNYTNKPLEEEVKMALRWGAHELNKAPKRKISFGRRKPDLPPSNIREEDIDNINIVIDQNETFISITISSKSDRPFNEKWFSKSVKQFHVMQAVKIYEEM